MQLIFFVYLVRELRLRISVFLFALGLLSCEHLTEIKSADELSAQHALTALAKERIWLAKALKIRALQFKSKSEVGVINFSDLKTKLHQDRITSADQGSFVLQAVTNDGAAYFHSLQRTASYWKQYMEAKKLVGLDAQALKAQILVASKQIEGRVQELILDEKKNTPILTIHDCFSCSFSGPNGAGYMSAAQYQPGNDNDMVQDATQGGTGGDTDAIGICSRTVNIGINRCLRTLDLDLFQAAAAFIGTEGEASPAYVEALVRAGVDYYNCFNDALFDFDLCAMDAGFYKAH